MGALQLWDGPFAFHSCYCDKNYAPAKDNETSRQPLLGGQALTFCWGDHTGRIVLELAKVTDKMDKIHNHVESPMVFSRKGQVMRNIYVSLWLIRPSCWLNSRLPVISNTVTLSETYTHRLQPTYLQSLSFEWLMCGLTDIVNILMWILV